MILIGKWGGEVGRKRMRRRRRRRRRRGKSRLKIVFFFFVIFNDQKNSKIYMTRYR